MYYNCLGNIPKNTGKISRNRRSHGAWQTEMLNQPSMQIVRQNKSPRKSGGWVAA
jgi:hypothetical protein